MIEQEQTKALGELDGWKERNEPEGSANPTCWYNNDDRYPSGKDWRPNYLTSYDAIIPLVQKQDIKVRTRIAVQVSTGQNNTDKCYDYMMQTPSQLCEALLRATGKWIE